MGVLMPSPHDPWFLTFLVAYAAINVTFVGAIVVQAIRFYRHQRADRSTGNVVPFQQERK
jgi:hypothetical protein